MQTNTKAILDQPIHDFRSELSVRTCNALAMADIVTLKDLVAKDERALRKVRNCGRVSFYEITEFLTRHGLALAGRAGVSLAQLKSKIVTLELTIQEKNGEVQLLSDKLQSVRDELDRFAQRYSNSLSRNEAVLGRLEVQVGRFEQLMSKIFRKERREALALEIEKLDNGELP
jgi:Bacterial RNA polymerase, alpha chain C terminal domain